jgi:hypothetical protein
LEALVKAIPRRAGDLGSRGLGAVCGALARWRAASVPLLAALAKSVSAVDPGEVEPGTLQGPWCSLKSLKKNPLKSWLMDGYSMLFPSW